jgi:hypothetical protein
MERTQRSFRVSGGFGSGVGRREADCLEEGTMGWLGSFMTMGLS